MMFRVCILICIANINYGSALVVKNSSTEVCFTKLGCFPKVEPWVSKSRPLPTPSDPAEYDPHLVFFSRNEGGENSNGIKIPLYPDIHFGAAKKYFRVERKHNIFLFTGQGSARLDSTSWAKQLKNALLTRVDANIFVQSSGRNNDGSSIDRFVSAANAVVIARLYIIFIERLKEAKMLKSNNIWIIGYADGAHIAGYVGSQTDVGRITGLDPLQELYEGQPLEIRLDPSDAKYVDVVHTDARPLLPDIGFGVMNPCGHVDFYINGAHQQPGCALPRPLDVIGQHTFYNAIKEPVRMYAEAILCAHKFSHRIFIAAIQVTDCTIWGHPGSYENFLKAITNAGTQGASLRVTGLLDKCDLKSCVPLGIDSPTSSARGIFIVTTIGYYPYCMDGGNLGRGSAMDSFLGTFKDKFVRVEHGTNVSVLHP